MTYETDPDLDADAKKFACYALFIAHWNPEITDAEFNAAWEKAKVTLVDGKSILDGNDIMQNPQGFVDILGYPLDFQEGHFPADTPLDGMYVGAEWQRRDPDGSVTTHFVGMDGRGTARENVNYDPIEGGSRTVREGFFVSYRLFKIRAV
jgi:hypothetical protein